MQDRTEEFFSTVKSIRSRQGHLASAPVGASPSRTREQTDFVRRFNNASKAIASKLTETYEKLERLAMLAAKRGMYDDKPLEIDQLTDIIKQDINELNDNISQLQKFVKENDPSKTQQSAHSKSVILSLQSKLAGMSTKFKTVLETRQQNLRTQRERRNHFSRTGALPAASGMSLLEQEGDGNSEVAIDIPHQSMAMVDRTSTYIQERADAMQNIENVIVELGGIFRQLATVVAEQGESLQRIDANIQDTEVNVEAAHGELIKHLQNVSSNRWLMLKIFGVLIFFFIIFVVFLA